MWGGFGRVHSDRSSPSLLQLGFILAAEAFVISIMGNSRGGRFNDEIF